MKYIVIRQIELIYKAVEEKFQIDNSEIQIECNNGHLIVSGKVSNEIQKDHLQEIVEFVSGTDEHIYDIDLEDLNSDEISQEAEDT